VPLDHKVHPVVPLVLPERPEPVPLVPLDPRELLGQPERQAQLVVQALPVQQVHKEIPVEPPVPPVYPGLTVPLDQPDRQGPLELVPLVPLVYEVAQVRPDHRVQRVLAVYPAVPGQWEQLAAQEPLGLLGDSVERPFYTLTAL